MNGNTRVWGELGDPLPRTDPHGVSVHLPTWEATLGWATRDLKVVKRMKTGYPRFFYHRIVVELGDRVRQIIDKSGLSDCTHSVSGPNYTAALFPSIRAAHDFRAYLEKHGEDLDPAPVAECYFLSMQDDGQLLENPQLKTRPIQWHDFELAIVIFPASDDLLALLRQFWMHAGPGICSRYAEVCLDAVEFCTLQRLPSSFSVVSTSNNQLTRGAKTYDSSVETFRPNIGRDLNLDDLRNKLRIPKGDAAKGILKSHLAILNSSALCQVDPNDVFLYPTGMWAITTIAGALRSLEPASTATIVVFGFLYVDTFKTIERVHGWPTLLLGQASYNELDDLSMRLKHGLQVAGLFLEVPGNPLLKSPDLVRIRRLADEYHFPIIIDDTVGTPVNVCAMPFADILATSLTKMFSGACNVMGGALTLNRLQRRSYDRLKAALQADFVDAYFPAEAEIMEKNCRDFRERMQTANRNAELVVDVLRQSSAVSHVYYPRGSETQSHYDSYRRPDGGYGFLLSCDFHTPEAAVAFFDALETAKGPSLGTNFTLSCPYTLFAHWNEREWAARYGVGEYLVRISVGLEGEEQLKRVFSAALKAAEDVMLDKGEACHTSECMQ